MDQPAIDHVMPALVLVFIGVVMFYRLPMDPLLWVMVCGTGARAVLHLYSVFREWRAHVTAAAANNMLGKEGALK